MLLIAEDREGQIVGTVQLLMAMPDNQPHRGDIAKMLVHRKARRRGIAGRLMTAIDEAAREEGKTVLVLDSVTGGDAERLYERAGWKRVLQAPLTNWTNCLPFWSGGWQPPSPSWWLWPWSSSAGCV